MLTFVGENLLYQGSCAEQRYRFGAKKHSCIEIILLSILYNEDVEASSSRLHRLLHNVDVEARLLSSTSLSV